LEHVFFLGNFGGVTPSDPPLSHSRDLLVLVDAEGRLKKLEVVPPQEIIGAGGIREPDWGLLFSAAGLDMAKWRAIEPRWNPLYHSDARAAWEGTLPPSNLPARIEASAYQGVPVSFDIVGPLARPVREDAATPVAPQLVVFVPLMIVFVAGTSFFARRNLRMGRGDQRGATRLALANLVLNAIVWVLSEHHVTTLMEVAHALRLICFALFSSSVLWVGYVALEPFVRRRWPQVLVSWSRFLSGDWRDPLVGRDVLVGCSTGILFACLLHLEYFAPGWAGYQEGTLYFPGTLPAWVGPLAFLSTIIAFVYTIGISTPLFYLFFLSLLRAIIRNPWLAGVVVVFLLAPMVSEELITDDHPWVILPVALAGSLVLLTVLVRFGFLALYVTAYVTGLATFPMTFHASLWYSGYGYAALAIIAALALFGFRTSLGGRRVFELGDA
jgi:serine/threonine-protein kinase